MTSSTLPPPKALSELMAELPIALFLDFDGTLIEIASGPECIDVPGDIAQRLIALARRFGGRVALISGRSLDNIEQHVGVLNIARGGSHGAELFDANGRQLGSPPAPLDSATVEELQQLALQNDALFERKRHGAALHYRTRPKNGAAIEAAAAAIAKHANLTVKSGKCVVELVRPGANKASAVAAFMATPAFKASTPIFIGDDVTDEDGFIAAKEHGGFGIAVGERISENATYKLESVKDVHEWLEL